MSDSRGRGLIGYFKIIRDAAVWFFHNICWFQFAFVEALLHKSHREGIHCANPAW